MRRGVGVYVCVVCVCVGVYVCVVCVCVCVSEAGGSIHR